VSISSLRYPPLFFRITQWLAVSPCVHGRRRTEQLPTTLNRPTSAKPCRNSSKRSRINLAYGGSSAGAAEGGNPCNVGFRRQGFSMFLSLSS
jgi:hypothetical protein